MQDNKTDSEERDDWMEEETGRSTRLDSIEIQKNVNAVPNRIQMRWMDGAVCTEN
jgi:hypothetical protein